MAKTTVDRRTDRETTERTHSTPRVRHRSVPPALATPTDLEPDKARAITEALNRLVADAYVLYVKTKNFHWHVSGSHFRDYHLLFDEQAEAIFESIDPLAERVRRIGGTTLHSISQIAALATLDDDNEEFVKPEQMIQRLLDDNRKTAEQQRSAIELCESNDDTPSANLLQDFLDQTEKRIWFLHAIHQGGEHIE